jgi:hypothetical protein
MFTTAEPVPEDFYAALWIGALFVAANAAIDIFPAESTISLLSSSRCSGRSRRRRAGAGLARLPPGRSRAKLENGR